jgi:diguanylate cyclase (GGDEF)-like protein/PAS domain S-box-containing protein
MNPAIQKLFKMPIVEAIGTTPMVASPLTDPERYMANIKQAIETEDELSDELSYLDSDGELRWVSIRFVPEFDSNGRVATVLTISNDITDNRQAEEERQAHLHFLESLDRINLVLQEEGDIGQIMDRALDEVLDIFDCDRAYLVYPCDPGAATWSVPIECTKPEYPGAGQHGPQPMNEHVAWVMRTLLESGHPIQLGPGAKYPLPEIFLQQFNIHSNMVMAVFPKVDKPWQFGIHQCSHDRIWSDQEVRLFEEIGNRLSDGLNSLLILRNLRQNEKDLRLAASVFANSQDGILISDTDNLIIDVNPAFTRLTGYTRDEAIGQNPSFMSAGKQDQEFYAEMWRSINKRGGWKGELWNRRKSGEAYAEMLSIVAVKDDKGRLQHYAGTFSDITMSKQHEADLDRIAHYDSLTSVPNRRLLNDRMRQAIARAKRIGKRLAVCYIDLDNFKPINDTFGHESGDMLLVEIAQRLQSLSRGDDTVARLGGDEFVLLWNDIGTDADCIRAIERVLTKISEPILIGDESVSVSVSIGVTLYPDDNVDADTLMRHADHAMYSAKQGGKNRYQMFDPRLERQISSRTEFLNKLANAIDENQFELYYQPKVDVVTSVVQGVEALLRWNDPILGLIGPKQFLPLIENDGLAFRMGRWVTEHAVRQAKIWDDMGMIMPISINIFPHHLKHRTFIDDLRNAIASHWPQMPSGRLLMEIVESPDLKETGPIEKVINACKEMGVGFSLDDFGTGFSSLVYLRHLSVEELKIEQSFVHNMLDNADDEAIVVSVISLGRAFKLRVVAEGVESTEQANHLIDLGCSAVQGYGPGRPMPPMAFEKWYADFQTNGMRMY